MKSHTVQRRNKTNDAEDRKNENTSTSRNEPQQHYNKLRIKKKKKAQRETMKPIAREQRPQTAVAAAVIRQRETMLV